jgi:hypothetical protein
VDYFWRYLNALDLAALLALSLLLFFDTSHLRTIVVFFVFNRRGSS